MTRFVAVRLIAATSGLSAVYYYLLTYGITLMERQHWPSWWYDVFPSRHIAASGWLEFMHTTAVFVAALPAAMAFILIDRQRATSLGVIAGALVVAWSLWQSLQVFTWHELLKEHATSFVVGHILIVCAIPVLIVIIRLASSNIRFERTVHG